MICLPMKKQFSAASAASAALSDTTIGPFYDPLESHIHIWKTGFLIKNLKNIEDPLKPEYSKIKITNFNKKYCCICHCIQPKQKNIPNISFHEYTLAREKIKKNRPLMDQPSSFPYSTTKDIVKHKSTLTYPFLTIEKETFSPYMCLSVSRKNI